MKRSVDVRNLPQPLPQPGPQTLLIQCNSRDVFFGGARGGGKSYGLIFDFLAREQQHGAASVGIIFRRTYLELRELIRISREILTPAGWKIVQGPPAMWTSPRGGTLMMAYLDEDADADNYQGFSFTWQGFDEAGNWPTPTAIDKLWATLRSGSGVPCVRRLTGNPGGPGHQWLKKRYVDPSPPFTPFLWSPNPDRPQYLIESVYIPSLLEDNKKLLEAQPDYDNNLASVGTDALYRAWRWGDWSVVSGQYFDCWKPEMAADEYTPEPWQKIWLSGDWGFEDLSVIHWHCMDDTGNIVTFRELAVNHKTPEELGDLIALHSDGLAPDQFYFAPDAFSKRTSAHTIADEIGVRLREHGLPFPSRADNDRIGGWQLMYQLLKNGKWRITKDCPVLLESLPLLQRETDAEGKSTEDVEDSPVDHAPDSARYGLKTHFGKVKRPAALVVNEKIRVAIAQTGQRPDLNDLIRFHKREEDKIKPKIPRLKSRYALFGR